MTSSPSVWIHGIDTVAATAGLEEKIDVVVVFLPIEFLLLSKKAFVNRNSVFSTSGEADRIMAVESDDIILS